MSYLTYTGNMRTFPVVKGLTRTADERAERKVWLLTLAFLGIGYFTPIHFSGYLLAAYFVLLAFVTLDRFYTRLLPRLGKVESCLYIGLVFATALIALLCPYGFENAFKLTLYLGSSIVVFRLFRIKEDERLTRAFYIIASVVITLTFLVFVANPIVYIDFGGYTHSTDHLAPLLPGVGDKNSTALFIFLYFCLSVKKRYKYGIVLSVLYPALYFGRQYVLMLLLAFALLVWFRLSTSGRHNSRKLFKQVSASKFMAVFLLCTIFMVGFSWIWVNYVIPNGVAGYKESLNDGSNAMRMLATQYALERADAEMPGFLLYGFDDQLFEQFGINRDTSVQFRNPQDTYYIDGIYRLVQPDEDIVNTLVKEGLFYTVIYYAIVSLLLSRLVSSYEDLAIVIPYIVGSMIINGMFTNGNLIMLLFVLSVSNRRVFSMKHDDHRGPTVNSGFLRLIAH